MEPLACALHFVGLSGLTAGQHLLVLGGGPAGLLTVLVGALAGLTVALSEPQPARRALGGVMGERVVAGPDELGDVLAEAGWRNGPDAIIEVTGDSSAVAEALDLAPPASTVVLTGVGLDARIAAYTLGLVVRELTRHCAPSRATVRSGRYSAITRTVEHPYRRVDRVEECMEYRMVRSGGRRWRSFPLTPATVPVCSAVPVRLPALWPRSRCQPSSRRSSGEGRWRYRTGGGCRRRRSPLPAGR